MRPVVVLTLLTCALLLGTSSPIAALAQSLISSWYSGSRGSIRRNSPTATASRITTAAAK